MTQKEINDYKGKLMSNMAAVRDSSNIVAAMINSGILKPKNVEETVTEINYLRNKFTEWHLQDISVAEQGKDTEKEESASDGLSGGLWRYDPITAKQAEIIEKILERVGSDRISEVNWRDTWTKGQASDFISAHPVE